MPLHLMFSSFSSRLLRIFMVSCVFTLAHVWTARAQIEGLRTGTLPNGLTYYVCHDGSTPGEAQFYLYQNVGAILENDRQKGLAHVLEHLAFNTTEHFPERVMTFLRSNNLHDFEAFTGKDETRYAVHNVPTANTALTDRMLLLLADWCHGIKMLPADVEKERGIVLEEWRSRYNVDQRMNDAIDPVLYNNARYAQRNVIGSPEILQQFKAKDVQRFYDTWYRPNLQFVAIVGDINPEEWEAKVKAVLSKVPNKKAPVDLDARTIADNATPLYTRFIDRENTAPSLGIYQRFDQRDSTRIAHIKHNTFFTQIFNRLAPRRFAALRNDGSEDFIAASVSLSPLVRLQSQMAWDVVPFHGKEYNALCQVLAVREDLRQHGFSETEFDAVRKEIYNGIKTLLESEEGLGTPDNLFQLFKENFLLQRPIKSFRQQLQDNLEELVELEVDDMNEWLRSMLDGRNLSFVTFSRTADEMNLTQAQFTEALAQADPSTVQPVAHAPITRLIDFDLPAGRITATQNITALAAQEWTLSNGALVFYKYVPNPKGRFFFAGSAPGGAVSITARDLPAYTAVTQLIMQSGVYNYSRNQLYEWVRNKDFDLSISSSETSSGIGGESAAAVADDFLGYAHLVLAHQRFDRNIFDRYVQRSAYVASTRSTTGMQAVQDSIQELLNPITPENPRKDADFYKKIRYEDLAPLFASQFGRAEAFTFCLVGDLPEAQARQLVERYLASLPGHADRRTATLQSLAPQRSLDFSSKAPEIKRKFLVDTEGDQGEIEIAYLNDLNLNEREQAALEVFRGLLENRYFEELREKARATYTIGVRSRYNAPTDAETAGLATLNIHFTTERARTDEMKARAYELLRDIAAGHFSADEFKAVQVPLAVNAATEETHTESNTPEALLWMGMLNVYAETGTVPQLPADLAAEVDKATVTSGKAKGKTQQQPKAQPTVAQAPAALVDNAFSQLTPEDVQSVATRLLQGARHRDIVVKALPPAERKWEK